ncbi:MAG: threonylcarbamoyl-AMP synthase [Candidatus Marinimicrobia bacterium]|nr:threonylcarbamoyl-AMP synthase [Candidatus Neomarinimicrobiota bacterium]
MILNYHDKTALPSVLKALNNKDVFIYPTDTLYGFGGDALSDLVLNKLYLLKQRPEHMPVSMLVRDKDMLSQFAYISVNAGILIDELLPGALTLILPAKNTALPDKLFSVEGYLGFRIPDQSFCNAMIEQFDKPVITTSVNISGHKPLNDIRSIKKQFGKEIELMISDPELDAREKALGSTVVMISKDDKWRLLREGAISIETIDRILL